MTGLESAGAFGAGKYRYECMTKCDQKQKTIAFESNTATITKIHDLLFFHFSCKSFSQIQPHTAS